MKHKYFAAAGISAVLGLMSLALSAKESYIGADSTIVVRDYIANMEYVNGVLDRVNFAGGYIDMTGESPKYMFYETGHLGNVRAVVDEDGHVCQTNNYYPYGDRFATMDPIAEKYYSESPYAYCAGNPVNRVDPDGLAWRLTLTSDIDSRSRYGNGYEWVDESESYDDNGNLLPGLYHQALFFSDNGNYDSKSSFNIGSSTAYLYLAGGSTVTYAALKMRDVGAKMNRIELGFTNPAYNDGRTYAEGIDIHHTGNNNFSNNTRGSYSRPVSAGCLLIDRNEWEQFMRHFVDASQVKSTVGVYVSRSISSPINLNVVKNLLLPLPVIEGRATLF